MRKFIILFFYIILHNLIADKIIWKPTFQFQDRRKHFIVICNGTGIANNISMFYSYHNKYYTVPRINSLPDVYIGNFSTISSEQSKVLIMCNNSNEFLGSKIYLLGYPPSFLAQRHEMNLNCRDFNLKKLVCCISPNISTIEQILGFEENWNGAFKAKFYFTESENKEVMINKSCYEVSDQVLVPTSTLHFWIENVLGSEIFNFTIDRLSIQKPVRPKFFLKVKNSRNFQFFVDMTYYGEYIINVLCASSSPITVSKGFSFALYHHKSDVMTSDNWPHNSKISCTFHAKVEFGNTTVGNSSDGLTVDITLLEAKPNTGPDVSYLYVDYLSVSNATTISDVTVYIADVALLDRNGIITKYQWMCDNCFYMNYPVSGIVFNMSHENRSLTLDHAVIGSGLSITACTHEGCSSTWSKFLFQTLKDETCSRQLSLIKNSNSPFNITILWHKSTNQNEALFLLVCTNPRNRTDCSSIERSDLNTNANNYMHYEISNSLQTRFALISTAIGRNYKLRWQSCFYNSLSAYDSQKKLQNFYHGPFINITMKCGFYVCSISLTIRIPRCEEFSDVFIKAFSIRIQNENDIEEKAFAIHAESVVEFTFSNVKTGLRDYVVNISVNTLHNSAAIHWCNIPLKTAFVCPVYIALIVFGIFGVFVVLVVVPLTLRKNWMTKEYKKRNDINQNRTEVQLINNACVTPVDLYNIDKKQLYQDNCVTPDNLDHYSGRYTSSNSIDNSALCTQSSGSEISIQLSVYKGQQNYEKVEDLSDSDSRQYRPRPMPDICQYSQLATPSLKNGKIVKATHESFGTALI